jgi:hypothetical protein
VSSQSPGVVFYVSGHGFGHATRTSAVIAELQKLRPELNVFVRSIAPRDFFPADVQYAAVNIDCGAVERGPGLIIDAAASIRELSDLVARAGTVVARETAWIRASGACAIVADVPFLAGEIAPELPHIAISNFTWDWIYEEMIEPGADHLLERIRSAYGQFSRALRLPFPQPSGWEMFKNCADVPLIARQSVRPVEEIRHQTRMDGRPVVLLGSRVTLSREILHRAAGANPEFQFVTLAPDAPECMLHVSTNNGVTFSDLLAASDVVVSKLGYSIVAECIAARKPLLYLTRGGFREEGVLEGEISKYIPSRRISLQEFGEGDWREGLLELASSNRVRQPIRTDGAAVCASIISATL